MVYWATPPTQVCAPKGYVEKLSRFAQFSSVFKRHTDTQRDTQTSLRVTFVAVGCTRALRAGFPPRGRYCIGDTKQRCDCDPSVCLSVCLSHTSSSTTSAHFMAMVTMEH